MADLTIAIKAQNQYGTVLKGLENSIKSAQSAAANASAQFRAMGDSLKNVGGKMTLGVTAPVLGFVGAALKGAMASEQLEVSFTTMLGSAEKAKQMMADLSKFAAATPFETPEIQNASKMLLAFGVAAEDIIPTMTGLGDIAAGLNIPLGDLAYLFGTTRAAGRLMTADLNQFTSRGIPMIAALAKTMGIAESEVKSFVEAGKVGFPEVQAALNSLTAEGGQFSGLMAAQSQTLAGLLSTFKDNIGLTLTAIGKQMIDSFNLKGALNVLNTQLEKVKNSVIKFAQTQPKLFKFIAIFLGVAAAIGPLLVGLGILMTTLAPLAPAIIGVAGAFSLLLGPLGLVAAALAALVIFDVGGIRTKMMTLVDSFKEWLGISSQVEGQSIKMGASINKMSPAMSALQGAIGTVASAWDKWRDAIARAENAMGKMQGTVQTERFMQLPDPSMIDRVASAFVRVRDALADFISTGDTAGIEAIFNSIRDAVSKIDLPSLSEVWEMAKVEITTVVSNLTWDVPGDIFEGLKTSVMDQLRSIWDNLFGGSGGPLKGVDTKNFDDFGMRAESIFAQAIKGIDSGAGVGKKNMFSPLVDFVSKQLASIDWSTLASGAAEGAGNMFDGVKGFVVTQLATIDWSTIGGMGKGALNFFAPLTGWVSEQLAGIDWAALPGDALTKLQAGATTLKDAVVGAITTFDFSIDPAKTAELSTLLDSVKPVFDKIFGPEGIVTTVNATINESLVAMGERLEKTDGKAVGEQFSTMLGGFLSVFTLFEGMKIEGSAERANAVIQLGTDVINFLSNFGAGIDAEALAASISGFATTFTTQLTTVFGNEENMAALGTAAGSLASSIITKIGEFFGKPGFGEEMGAAAGGAAGALATGAMRIVTGLATELGKVDWAQAADGIRSFVQGFAQGAGAAVVDVDWGSVGKAMAEAIGKAITGAVGGMFPMGIFGKDPFGMESAKAQADAMNATLLTGAGGAGNPLAVFQNFNWADYITALSWGTFITALGWGNFVTALTWGTWITSLSWGTWIDPLSWASWVNPLNWFDFINPFNTPEPVPGATGIRSTRGGLNWVGERGPELVALPRGSRIFSNSESMELADASPSIVIQQMIVRSDQDIYAIAYQLDDLHRRRRSRR